MEQMFIGMLIVLLFKIFDPKAVRIEWQKLGGFVAFMTLVVFLRLSLFDFLASTGSPIPSLPPELLKMPKFFFALVWWEDGFYVLPIMLAHKYLPKKYAMVVTLLLSVHFGMEHIYQGIGAVFITALYPYFIAHKLGEKHGYGTVMVGHVLYDYITYYTIFLAPLFI